MTGVEIFLFTFILITSARATWRFISMGDDIEELKAEVNILKQKQEKK